MVIDELLEQLDLAVGGSSQGKEAEDLLESFATDDLSPSALSQDGGTSTDMRTFSDDLLDAPVEEKWNVSPDGWLLEFPDPKRTDRSLEGPIGVLLVGHCDLDCDQFEKCQKHIFQTVHGDIEGSIFRKPPEKVDLRTYLFPGNYHNVFMQMFPKGYQTLHKSIKSLDAVSTHPMATSVISSLQTKVGKVSVQKIQKALERISEHLSEPGHTRQTTGDVIGKSHVQNDDLPLSGFDA